MMNERINAFYDLNLIFFKIGAHRDDVLYIFKFVPGCWSYEIFLEKKKKRNYPPIDIWHIPNERNFRDILFPSVLKELSANWLNAYQVNYLMVVTVDIDSLETKWSKDVGIVEKLIAQKTSV